MYTERDTRAYRRAVIEVAERNGRWLAVAALLLTGCGPTDQEIGVTIVSSLAIIVPLAAALNYGLHRLWRDTRELRRATAIEATVVCLATFVFVTALNIFVLPADGELLLIACWIIGATYLTFFSILIGGALAFSRRWAFRVLYWVPALLVALLALPLALEIRLESEHITWIMLVLLWSGGYGAIGGPLFLGLLGTSIYVFVRDRRPPPDPEPPLTF